MLSCMRGFIKTNRKWLIVVIEIICILGSLLLFTRPLKSFEFTGEMLEQRGAIFIETFPNGMQNGYYIDDSMVEDGIAATDLEANYFIRTPKIDLTKGSYEAKISYSTGGERNDYTSRSDSNQYTVRMGREHTDLISEKEENVFTFESNSPVRGYQLTVNFENDGYIFVNEISVKETNAWKIKQLLGVVTVVLLLNVVLYLYYTRQFLFSKENLTIAVLLGAVIVFSSIPVFSAYLYSGHDLPFHLNRIEGIKNALLAGQFPVRMQHTTLGGAGYPVSVFYGDLFLYIPAILRILGWSVQDAYQIYVLLVNLATCAIMYIVVKKIFKNEWIGVLGAVVYMLAPYRLECIYLRAAVGEYTAMCFYPLVIYGIYRIYTDDPKEKESRGNWIILALAFTGLVNCHVISTFSAFLLTALFCVICIRRTLRWDIFSRLLKSALLAVGLCFWFIIPFLDYMGVDVRITDVSSAGVYAGRTLTLNQLLSVFSWGKGMMYSIPNQLNGEVEMPYAIGGAFLVVLILYVVCLINLKHEKSNVEKFGKISFAFSVITLFMTTVYFPWDHLEHMGKLFLFVMQGIQLPWRFLGAASVLMSFTAAAAAYWMLRDGKRGILQSGISAILVFAVISASYFMTDYMQQNEKIYYCDEQDVNNGEIGTGEYLLQGAEFGYDEEVSGSEGVAVTSFGREKDIFVVECVNLSEEEQYVDIPVLNYPNYIAEDSAGETIYRIDAGEKGRIRVCIPGYYQGKICVKYCSPWYWRISEIVSALSVIGLIGFYGSQKGERLRWKTKGKKQ